MTLAGRNDNLRAVVRVGRAAGGRLGELQIWCSLVWQGWWCFTVSRVALGVFIYIFIFLLYILIWRRGEIRDWYTVGSWPISSWRPSGSGIGSDGRMCHHHQRDRQRQRQRQRRHWIAEKNGLLNTSQTQQRFQSSGFLVDSVLYERKRGLDDHRRSVLETEKSSP